MPLFLVNATIDTTSRGIDPSANVMKKIIKQLISLWVETATRFELCLSDPFFNPFLQ